MSEATVTRSYRPSRAAILLALSAAILSVGTGLRQSFGLFLPPMAVLAPSSQNPIWLTLSTQGLKEGRVTLPAAHMEDVLNDHPAGLGFRHEPHSNTTKGCCTDSIPPLSTPTHCSRLRRVRSRARIPPMSAPLGKGRGRRHVPPSTNPSSLRCSPIRCVAVMPAQLFFMASPK